MSALHRALGNYLLFRHRLSRVSVEKVLQRREALTIAHPSRRSFISRQVIFHRCTNLDSSQSICNNAAFCITQRSYAKGKNKGNKGKGSKAGHILKLSDQELASVVDIRKMNASYEAQVDQLRTILTAQLEIRGNSLGKIGNAVIKTSDGDFPLIQLGHVSQKGLNLIVIDLSDSSQYIQATMTTLMDKMGLNPQRDGTKLFVNIPKVTREHREELANSAKKMIHSTKQKLSEVYSKYRKNVQNVKDDHATEIIHSVEHYVLAQMKHYEAQADALLAAKVKELTGDKS